MEADSANTSSGPNYWPIRGNLFPGKTYSNYAPALKDSSGNMIKLSDVLSQIYSWLDAHISEAVVVSIKEDPYPVNSPDTTIDGAVYSLINPKSDKYWHLKDDRPALETVRAKLLLMRRYSAPDGPTTIGMNVYGGWPGNETKTFTTKWNQGVQPLLSAASADLDPDKWYVNFTSGYSVPFVYPLPMATGYVYIIPSGQGVNSKLYGWVTSKSTARYGIMVMDFPQQPYGDLISYIIKSNPFTS